MPFDKGGSDGSDPSVSATGMRLELIAMLGEPSDDGHTVRRRAVVGALLRLAEEGDLAAIREVFDRSDGKAQVMAAPTDAGDRKVTFQWLDMSSDTPRAPNLPPSTPAANDSPAS
jgi:hypothetical protein